MPERVWDLNMKHPLFRGAKVVAATLILGLFASSTFAQSALRKALDYDGDGKADFSVFRPSDGYWYIQKTDGSYLFQPWGIANDDFLTPGDFDGDGKADIAIWRDSSGYFYWINSGSNTVGSQLWGMSGDEPVARDYDGDGKTDPAVVRRSGGVMSWYILGSQAGYTSAAWGASTDYTAPGDYDGDGKFDIAVQRGIGLEPAAFYILGSQMGYVVDHWGYGSDIFVPGDYDGDGKTDLAVIREGATPTDALSWYVKRSSDGSFFGFAFGATGTDYAVQGDYDGDGKTDVAVWRNSNGIYYIWGSMSNSLFGTTWGGPNDLPIASYDNH